MPNKFVIDFEEAEKYPPFTAPRKRIIDNGGKGSGNFKHKGRPGQVGGSGKGVGQLVKDRVWNGEQHERDSNLDRLEYAKKGEDLAISILKEKFGADFENLNVGINNSPIDVAGDHTAVEVKTGLATNGKSAQMWRATIGQPGPREAELYKKMSAEEKRVWYERKNNLIIKRKLNLLSKMSKESERAITPITVGVIMSADGKRADVYIVPGFHLYLGWNRYATDEYYEGTYDV